MYLSEGGVDCEDTCKQVNDTFGCFNRINTHESNALFETSRDPTNYTLELNITCKPTLNRLYTKTLHPSFDISTSQCEGYLDAPLKINCTAEEPINANTRRLCYCIDIGKIIFVILCSHTLRPKNFFAYKYFNPIYAGSEIAELIRVARPVQKIEKNCLVDYNYYI